MYWLLGYTVVKAEISTAHFSWAPFTFDFWEAKGRTFFIQLFIYKNASSTRHRAKSCKHDCGNDKHGSFYHRIGNLEDSADLLKSKNAVWCWTRRWEESSLRKDISSWDLEDKDMELDKKGWQVEKPLIRIVRAVHEARREGLLPRGMSVTSQILWSC